jgi:pyruvate,water dikinase
MAQLRRFVDPHDPSLDIPGTEGWQEAYPYNYMFRKEEPASSYESSQFWFCDVLHTPEAMKPLEAAWWVFIRPAYPTARTLCPPPAYGMDRRILNGYNYCANVAERNPEVQKKRAELFRERSSYSYRHWEMLYDVMWHKKFVALIDELNQIHFPLFPEFENESVIKEGTGYSAWLPVVEAYSKMINIGHRAWQNHFQYNTLAYGANAAYITAMKRIFPGIGDKSITQTVMGFDAAVFRPPVELQRLATSAVETRIADAILSCAKWEEVPPKLQQTDAGRKWLAQLEAARWPWFEMATGVGYYGSTERAWNDDLNVPLTFIKNYIEALKRGESITKPLEDVIKERDRVTAEYRSLIKTDEDRETFGRLLGTARLVAPFAEDHIFYVENWFNCVFHRKERELGQFIAHYGVIEDPEDVWYFNLYDIYNVLQDISAAWYTGTVPLGKTYWPPKMRRRKEVWQRFSEWRPPMAFGPPPDVITDANVIALYGVTTELVDTWLEAKEVKPEEVTQMKGYAGSAGVVEGTARVCITPADISMLKAGEIMVAPTTNPSWAPAFQIISGSVVDVGGTFSHGAIVAREYRLPCVPGTGIGTKAIKTGDKIRVDGDKGIVTILERAK